MRYPQYTHKISVPMRKELYDFLRDFPHGVRAQIARTYLLKIKSMLENFPNDEGERKAMLYDLVNGNYRLETETEIQGTYEARTDKD